MGLESVCSPDPGVDVSLSGGGLKPLAAKFGSQGPSQKQRKSPPEPGPFASSALVGTLAVTRREPGGRGQSPKTGRGAPELRTTKGTQLPKRKEKQRGRRKTTSQAGMIHGVRHCPRCLIGATRGAGGNPHAHDRLAPNCALYANSSEAGSNLLGGFGVFWGSVGS